MYKIYTLYIFVFSFLKWMVYVYAILAPEGSI